MIVPAFAVERTSRISSTILTNTVAVLVRHDGDIVLVDAGWSEAACDAPYREIGFTRAKFLGVSVKPEDSIARQLEARGFARDKVSAVIATHLHFDHIGGVCDFPNAELVVTSNELAAFRKWPRDSGYRLRDLPIGDRISAVELRDGPFGAWDESLDIFDDGSVILLDSKGHTPGLLAVHITHKNQRYLHAGDAVYKRWELNETNGGPATISRFTRWNDRELRASYARLRSLAGTTIVPSHDADALAEVAHLDGLNT